VVEDSVIILLGGPIGGDCYVTYAATVDAHQDGTGIKRNISREAVFELCQERYDPPLESPFQGLPENRG
jgi:hypothetical protein